MTPEAMQILVPLLSHCHSAFQDSQDTVPLGPYFPRRGHSIPIVPGKGSARPLRPMVQMTVPQNQLECSRVSLAIYFLFKGIGKAKHLMGDSMHFMTIF